MSKENVDVLNAARVLKGLGAKRWKHVRFRTVLRSVSWSGMTRIIGLYVEAPNRGLVCLAYGIKVHGCGMDMGFHLSYCVYTTLFPYVNGKQSKPYQDHMSHSWL